MFLLQQSFSIGLVLSFCSQNCFFKYIDFLCLIPLQMEMNVFLKGAEKVWFPTTFLLNQNQILWLGRYYSMKMKV